MLKEYQHITHRSFEDAIETLKTSLMNRKFGTLCSIALSEKFKEKGIDFDERLTILEVCNPFEANTIISISPEAIYLLPCKIIVREKNNTTTIQMATPSSLVSMFDDPKLLKVAQEIESILIAAIQEV